MAKQYYVIRFLKLIKKRGFFKTIGQIYYIIRRDYFQNKFIIFYTDLDEISIKEFSLPGGYAIELKKKMSDISPEDLVEIIEHHSIGKIVKVNMEKRFDKGAWLWCIKYKSKLVGFLWSINKTPMEPYFFPLTEKDVHLFNNEIFVEYRGRGINTLLINCVLFNLKKKGFQRTYIETGIWNRPEQRSLSKTFFKAIAVVSKRHRFNRIITTWHKRENILD